MYEFGALDIANAVLVFIIMFGVGTSLDIQAARRHFNKKLGICAGVLNQYVIGPLLLWGFALIDPNMPMQFRAGMVVIGTCPGGVLSNVVCMWLHSDPSLSITLTTVTVILSLGVLPLNLYLYLEVAGLGTPPDPAHSYLNLSRYGNSSSDFKFKTDWIGLCVSIVSVIGGVILGILIQYWIKSKKILKRLELLGMLTCIPQAALALVTNTKSGAPVWAMPTLVYVFLLTPTVISFFWAQLTGRYILRLPKPSSTALAIEACVQNVNVAIGVISLSIADRELRAQALGIPLAHGTITVFVTVGFGMVLWKLGWTDLDPRGRNPCSIWCREYYETAILGHHPDEDKTLDDNSKDVLSMSSKTIEPAVHIKSSDVGLLSSFDDFEQAQVVVEPSAAIVDAKVVQETEDIKN